MSIQRITAKTHLIRHFPEWDWEPHRSTNESEVEFESVESAIAHYRDTDTLSQLSEAKHEIGTVHIMDSESTLLAYGTNMGQDWTRLDGIVTLRAEILTNYSEKDEYNDVCEMKSYEEIKGKWRTLEEMEKFLNDETNLDEITGARRIESIEIYHDSTNRMIAKRGYSDTWLEGISDPVERAKAVAKISELVSASHEEGRWDNFETSRGLSYQAGIIQSQLEMGNAPLSENKEAKSVQVLSRPMRP